MRTERIFILSLLITTGLGILVALQPSSAGVDNAASAVWPLRAALVLVAAAGAIWIRRSGATGSKSLVQVSRLPLEVLLPSLLVLGFTIFLQIFAGGWFQIMVLALGGLSLLAVFWAQAHTSDAADRYFGLAQTSLNVCSHLTAFLLFSAIYGLKVRALASATAVGVVAALLIYEMLRRDRSWHIALNLPVEGRWSTLMLLAAAAGLVCAELTWGLNYWAALTTLVGGACLLLAFYVTYGLIASYVDHRLTRSTLLEFAGVGTLGLIVVFASAFFS